MLAVSKLMRVGSSRYARIPARMLRALGWAAGTEVMVMLDRSTITIQRYDEQKAQAISRELRAREPVTTGKGSR